ncbi:hypothetical protein [Sedimentibacter sp. MB31-C6]|uniref:hypothetical protein n=1 Tax=Sedimentibacter sp. MB31-C6 TaxID=3109366 RepID=UPI002DDD1C80|nr:hypothetical protein [Sedimentibacter sp. MB36-C1]WSI03646.1 hypothetical protein U8307_11370 [Sedimentibacter sp. MB36-C1]
MKYYSNPYKFKCMNINKFDKNDYSNERAGYLEITVIDAQTGMPIKDVDIEVFILTISGNYAEKGISQLIERYSTDENGTIPILELPLIEWPNNRYFALIDVFGYYSITIVNIPIYEEIKTIYNVEMNLITSPTPIREYIRTPSKTEYYTSPLWYF